MRREYEKTESERGRAAGLVRRTGICAALLAALVLAVSGCSSEKYPKLEEGVTESAVEETSAEEENDAVDGTADAAAEETGAAAAESSQVAAPISQAAAMEACEDTVYVSASDVNVREAPDTEAAVVTRLNRGTELARTGFNDSWSRVVYQDAECYISSQYLTTEPIEETEAAATASGGTEVGLNSSWTYAEYSKISSGKAILYRSEAADRKEKVVCVNAGHGTSGGSSVKTLCHPDGTPKVTGGSTAAGATSATAVSSGMVFADGTAEPKVTLAMAKALKEKLLARGYDGLMI
ncbi:MAG: SH3 domain-containing protein, partial [Clostridiales bacterium]|nr:SH3 domain-containing protein [Clostridiales bacterium]